VALFHRVLGVAALCVALQAPAAMAATARYATHGDCAGFPKISLSTPAGWCVGLVAQSLLFPRGLAVLPNGDVLVAEMGSWTPKRGRLSLLRKVKHYARETVFDGLDRPHGVVLGPDGRVYVGVVGGLFRYDPANPLATRADVIGGASGVPALPVTGQHILTAFVFDRRGDLFVNVGSHSNNCEGEKDTLPDTAKPCAEAEGANARGVIRRYAMRWPAGTVAGVEVYASGLRNSMALAVHRGSNTLLQAENARDAIHKRDPRLADVTLPHDELNVIQRGKQYGWPYCYDNNRASPEYRTADCRSKTAPHLLLPPHAAPLGMAIDNEAKLPAPFTGTLLMAYHGYRQFGHRVLAFKLDANGLPRGNPVELVSGWIAKPAPNAQPIGSPVDVRIAADGSVFISEDRNGTVLRLARQ
jgi:glucose/arabinose dehydrogenase